MFQTTKPAKAIIEVKTAVLAESDEGKVTSKKRKHIKVRTSDLLISELLII